MFLRAKIQYIHIEKIKLIIKINNLKINVVKIKKKIWIKIYKINLEMTKYFIK